MTTTVIRVVVKTAKVHAQPVNRVVVAPGDGARVVVVPTPGPPGPTGPSGQDTGLTPEVRQTLLDDAEGQTLEDLVPPVSLVLLFQNGLA
jgi:hypothetical protein